MSQSLSTHSLVSPQKKYQIYDFIVAYALKHRGKVPPLRLIMKVCGLLSTSTTYHQMNRMVAFGMLEKDGRNYALPGFTAVSGMRFLSWGEYMRLSRNGGS